MRNAKRNLPTTTSSGDVQTNVGMSVVSRAQEVQAQDKVLVLPTRRLYSVTTTSRGVETKVVDS